MRSQSPDRIYLYHRPPGMYTSQRIFDRGSTMLHLSRAILRYIFQKQSTGIANSTLSIILAHPAVTGVCVCVCLLIL